MSSPHFEDNARIIHFVLVYKTSALDEDKKRKLETFLNNVKKIELDTETTPLSDNDNVIFVKIHATDSFVFRCASIVDVELACRSVRYRGSVKLFASPLSDPDILSTVRARSRTPSFIERPSYITSAEKILVIYKVINTVRFGSDSSDFGVDKLIRDKVLLDAYPLHDGPYQYSEEGELNDRQLLALYWGNFNSWWHLGQPLMLVEKYFGPEYAFYFAFLGFYVKMLIPIAVLSITCLIYGLSTIKTTLNTRSIEICNSDMLMCPKCHYSNCKLEMLKNSCMQSYLTYLFDNPATIFLSVVVSFWSTVFMERWQRVMAVLQLQWNVKHIEDDISVRNAYIEKANSTRYSEVKQEYEPYVTRGVICYKYTITTSSITFLLLIVCLAVLGVTVYRLSVNMMLIRDSKDKIIQRNTRLIASATGAVISASFIIVFRMIYGSLALWLTEIENHRSQLSFDGAYIFKHYALAFTNNYAPVLYIAFFKGKFFTYPGDTRNWTFMGGINSDICDPSGCILDLGIQLIIIMIVKITVSNVTQLILPIIISIISRFQLKIKQSTQLTVYENEYLLSPTDKYFLIDEYMDMVIQYGFVVFFVAGFPLAPFLALINNALEIRVDAFKLTKSYRRPMPQRVAGIGAWFGILQAITYAGVVTNALVIAFTSDFMSIFIYRMTISSSYGYTNTSLSEFSMKDFKISARSIPKPLNDSCYYPGKRYPPSHPNKYQLTGDHWYMLAFRFALVIFFEHIVIMLKGILAYSIPDVPDSVSDELARRERTERELRGTMRVPGNRAGTSRDF